MKIEQIYTGCIAHAAYYLESNGEAAIFDPLREVQPYIDRATKDDAKIKYIFETHFHADFVSGHLDLEEKTGAAIVFGPTARPEYKAIVAEDNQVFEVGAVQIKVLHTPGHTMESTCYLLIDEMGLEQAIITGDTLFIGDVGRPDLAQHVSADLTEEKLAGLLFDSLRNKIMPLKDELIVYPNHGAGSACGKRMSKETSDTLGNQKRTNYALNPELTKDQFVKAVLEGLVAPPGYFPHNVLMNIKGYESFDAVKAKAMKGLSPTEFEAIANELAPVVIDTRDAEVFAKAFIPGSINIGSNGSFASWVGTVVKDVKSPLLIIADPDRVEEVITRLARVGFDHCLGYLKGGVEAWILAGKEVDRIVSITADELASTNKINEVALIDARKASEFESEHIENAINIPLDFINHGMAAIDKAKTYYVHCAGGYRSMIFISILRARGFDKLVDVKGGLTALKQTKGWRVTDYVSPATAL